MALDLRVEPVPLTSDPHGVVRVAGTRVTLDTVVSAFHEGLGPEEIVERYSSLSLADIYSVIGYYLRHRSALDAYLTEQRLDADRVRVESQMRWPPHGLRAKLLARRQNAAQ